MVFVISVASLTTGQLLCGGLFSPDALSNWYSAVALSHSLVDNPAQKEQLLRVLLATTAGGAPSPEPAAAGGNKTLWWVVGGAVLIAVIYWLSR